MLILFRKLNRELQMTIREYWEARGKYFLSYYIATMHRLLLPRKSVCITEDITGSVKLRVTLGQHTITLEVLVMYIGPKAYSSVLTIVLCHLVARINETLFISEQPRNEAMVNMDAGPVKVASIISKQPRLPRSTTSILADRPTRYDWFLLSSDGKLVPVAHLLGEKKGWRNKSGYQFHDPFLSAPNLGRKLEETRWPLMLLNLILQERRPINQIFLIHHGLWDSLVQSSLKMLQVNNPRLKTPHNSRGSMEILFIDWLLGESMHTADAARYLQGLG
uniref:Uncharacterized protein n=1 Tax=Salix viminalis TaxID=40686 RepID=A0A6N2NBY0_SALVM